MFCVQRLFGSCWGVSAHNRALLEAHYGPASTEADAEDFGEWAEQDDEEAPRAASAAPQQHDAAHEPPHVPAPLIVPPTAPRPTVTTAGGAASRSAKTAPPPPTAAEESAPQKEEDFFADMQPTVTRQPVVPVARAATQRLAFSVRDLPVADAMKPEASVSPL
jgi:hypothetical protein